MASMTPFQWIVIPLLLLAMAVTVVAARRTRLAGRWVIAWMMLWAAAIVAVAVPGLLAWLANVLGIGRGADLTLYAAILFMFAGFFVLYLRYRRVAEQLTTVVRHLAIMEARSSHDSDVSSGCARKGPVESEAHDPADH
jgi:small membrane protein